MRLEVFHQPAKNFHRASLQSITLTWNVHGHGATTPGSTIMKAHLLLSSMLTLFACVEFPKPEGSTETVPPEDADDLEEVGDPDEDADPEETGDTAIPEEDDPFSGMPEAAAARCDGQTPTLPVAGEEEALEVVSLSLPIAETSYIVQVALGLAEYLSQPWAACAELSSDPFTGATLVEASCVDVHGYTLTGSMRWRESDEGFSLEADEITVLDPGYGTLILDGEQEFHWLDDTRWTYEIQGRVSLGEPEEEPQDRELSLEAYYSDTRATMAGWVSIASGLGERTGGACLWYTDGEELDPCVETDPVGMIVVGADTYEGIEECGE